MAILENIFAIKVTNDNIERKSELLLLKWWRVIGFFRKLNPENYRLVITFLKTDAQQFLNGQKGSEVPYVDNFRAC